MNRFTSTLVVLGMLFGVPLLALLALVLAGLLEPAFAQAVATVTTPASAPTSTNVVVPYGDWLTWSLTNLRDLIVTSLAAVSTWGVARFMPSLIGAFQAARVEQLIGRAVDFAIASVEGAAHGQEVSIPVANAVLQRALEMAVESAPKLAKKIEETIRPKIIARMAAAGIVPAEASVGLVLGAEASPAGIMTPVVGFVPASTPLA